MGMMWEETWEMNGKWECWYGNGREWVSEHIPAHLYLQVRRPIALTITPPNHIHDTQEHV